MLPDGLIVIDALTAPYAREDAGLLVVSLSRNQNRDRFADSFFGGIAKQPLRALIPTHNDAVQIFADNGVIRRLDDGGQSLTGLFGLLQLGDILKYVDRAAAATVHIVQGIDVYVGRDPGAIRTFNRDLFIPRCLTGFYRYRHWRFAGRE